MKKEKASNIKADSPLIAGLKRSLGEFKIVKAAQVMRKDAKFRSARSKKAAASKAKKRKARSSRGAAQD